MIGTEPAEMFCDPTWPNPRRDTKKASWYFKNSNECAAMRAMVRTILNYPFDHRWTVQGFGMLRMYMPGAGKRFRLNVWSSALAVPKVSIMHDHPWAFDSWIINGQFRNVRYVEDYHNGDAFEFMTIKCGEEGCSISQRALIRLRSLATEYYNTGDTYHQDATEIHASFYDDGTVTLNDRIGDTEQARVFWPAPGVWVDAKPREATRIEIAHATSLALGKWHETPNI